MGRRRLLKEEEVIQGVVEGFNSDEDIDFDILYGQKQISLGEEVRLGRDVKPTTFIFVDIRLFILIMTNPYAPEGEYLHWLFEGYVTLGQREVASTTSRNLLEYEAPTCNCTLVSTLFRSNKPLDFLPSSRKDFSTKNFAERNELGKPVGATYFKIIKDEEEPSTLSSARNKKEKNVDESRSKRIRAPYKSNRIRASNN